jgi:hypothetical protein
LHYGNVLPVTNVVKEEENLFVAPSSWYTQVQLDASRLKAELPRSLPQPMIPSVYLPLINIPLTVTGKIDRRRIREIIRKISWFQLQQYAHQRVEHVRPQSVAEATLHALLSQVCRFSQILSECMIASCIMEETQSRQCLLHAYVGSRACHQSHLRTS